MEAQLKVQTIHGVLSFCLILLTKARGTAFSGIEVFMKTERENNQTLEFICLYPLIKLYLSTKNQLSASVKQNKCTDRDQ